MFVDAKTAPRLRCHETGIMFCDTHGSSTGHAPRTRLTRATPGFGGRRGVDDGSLTHSPFGNQLPDEFYSGV